MHMGRSLPEDNSWHSNSNGPSMPPPVIPQPPVPVVQPTGPPSETEFEMLQTRIQSMDPIIVWNLVRIKILPNFSPWDFLCDRTRLCGPKHGQNGGNKLPTSVAKLKFLLQEMNDLAEELSHLVDNCCETIDDSEPEDDSEEPEEMEEMNEEELPETETKSSENEKPEGAEEKSDEGTEQNEKESSETTEDSVKGETLEKAKEVEEDKSSNPAVSEAEPMNTESDPNADSKDATEETPTINGDVNPSENSIDSISNNAEKDETKTSEKPIENDTETSNSDSQKEQPTGEENKVFFKSANFSEFFYVSYISIELFKLFFSYWFYCL